MGPRQGAIAAIALLACLLTACAGDPATTTTAPVSGAPSGAGHPKGQRTPRVPRSTAAPTSRAADPGRPNIILLLTDDQTTQEMAYLPQTQRWFTQHGTTFTHAFSQYPLCCPARGSLLTGQLPHNHGAMGNKVPWGAWPNFRDEADTLPVWLQGAGYRTAIIGKYLNGYPAPHAETLVPPGWTDWRVPVTGEYNYMSRVVNENGRLVRRNGYQSTYLADEVTGLIDSYSADDAPFFIWAGFLAPHDGGPADPVEPDRSRPPFRSPYVEPRYRGTESGELGGAPSIFESDLSDKDELFRHPHDFTREDLEIQAEQRRESLHSADDAVMRIIDELRATGELGNTELVFVFDNGFLLGEHGLDQKIYGYEESVRVPLMMAGPGVPAGAVRDQLVGIADLAPTMLSWSGATTDRLMDGVSLTGALHDPRELQHRDLLLEAGGEPFPRVDRLYTGVRTWDGKVLLRYWNGWVETYDLSTDPFELDGRTSPAEATWRDDLIAELDDLETCAGADCLVD